MIFGLTNTPFVFSKPMSKVLGPLNRNTAVWYLDDILIPAMWKKNKLCGYVK